MSRTNREITAISLLSVHSSTVLMVIFADICYTAWYFINSNWLLHVKSIRWIFTIPLALDPAYSPKPVWIKPWLRICSSLRSTWPIVEIFRRCLNSPIQICLGTMQLTWLYDQDKSSYPQKIALDRFCVKGQNVIWHMSPNHMICK